MNGLYDPPGPRRAGPQTALILPWEPQRIYSFPSDNYTEAVDLTRLLCRKAMISPGEIRNSQVTEILAWSREMRSKIRTLAVGYEDWHSPFVDPMRHMSAIMALNSPHFPVLNKIIRTR